MTLSITLPQLNSKSKSTKDQIISILSNEWPLSAKEIHARIQKNGESVSYQAIHKSLLELKQNDVVRSVEKKFILNVDWAKQIKKFGEQVERAYVAPAQSKNLVASDFMRNYRFNDAMELARFILDEFFAYPNPQNKPSICHWWNIYPTFSLSDSEYRRMKERLAATQMYMLGGTKTTMDKIFAENFEKLGAKVKIGVDIPFNPDTLVQGDYIGLIYFSPKFRQMWYNYCKVGKILNKLKMEKLLMLLYDHSDSFNVVVTKNAEIADRIREQTMAHFKGEKK